MRRQPVLFFCAVNRVWRDRCGEVEPCADSPAPTRPRLQGVIGALIQISSFPPYFPPSSSPLPGCVWSTHSDQQLPQRARPIAAREGGGYLLCIGLFPGQDNGGNTDAGDEGGREREGSGVRRRGVEERAAGTYYASAYFLAKTTAETLTQVMGEGCGMEG